MPRPRTTLNAKELVDILNACKDLPISRIRYMGLEVDFCAKVLENIADDEIENTVQIQQGPVEEDSDEVRAISTEEYYDSMKLTDPVEYDRAMRRGELDA